MKKFRWLYIIIFSAIIFAGCGCSRDYETNNASKNLSTYNIEMILNDDYTCTVNQVVNYKNNTGVLLEDIYFHLYPNAFSEYAKINTVSSLNVDKAYYNGMSYGNIDIIDVITDNNTDNYLITNINKQLLKVELDSPLSPDDSKQITINYNITIPNVKHRFGYGENTINLGNFYPIACVYESGSWVLDDYHYNGDPFYSDMSNYNVSIELNSKFKVASTGKQNVKSLSSEKNQITIQAKTVRDFALVISEKFKIVSEDVDGVNIKYYYFDDDNYSSSIKAGADAITTFDNLFGKYPYTTLSIVQTDFVHGGMEYPNLIYISSDVTSKEDYINVIIHEVAHQWWYGVVGNNEYKYGWLDEGMTEYSTLMFYELNPSYNVNSKEIIKNSINNFAKFVEVYTKILGNVDTSMNRSLNEFNGETEYVYMSYIKGLLFFDDLRNTMGDKNFKMALKSYYKKYKFCNAVPDNLMSVCEKVCRCNFKNYFDSWILGKVKILAVN